MHIHHDVLFQLYLSLYSYLCSAGVVDVAIGVGVGVVAWWSWDVRVVLVLQ